MFKKILFLLFTSLFSVANAGTLDEVKARDYLKCGVNHSLTGFAFPSDDGSWKGLDVDICKAIAAAVLGSADKIRFIPLSAKERFTALQSGEIDVLSRNTTWTFSRDASLGLDFTKVTFYDGQGFMVPKSLGVSRLSELSGATICTSTGTTTELNVADYFKANNLKYELVSFEKGTEVVAAYNSGRCDAYTADRSALAAQMIKLSEPEKHMLLPEVISKEPLGPVVRHGDNQWGDIVRWVINGLIAAEEYGIDSRNFYSSLNSENAEIKRLLGETGNLGDSLGLPNNFMTHVLKDVGNYGEIFERNLGPNTPLKLDRGLNDLWLKGGLMYSPPFR